MGRSFGEANIARNNRTAYAILKIGGNLLHHFLREFCTGIVHRKKDTADFKVGIDFFLHSFNGLQQKR